METAYSLNFNIDDVKTKTVERLISPLIHLITSLHANMQPLSGATRDGKEVMKRLKERLDSFIMTGQQTVQIKTQFPGAEKIFAQLNDALNDVALAGDNLLIIGEPFIADAENPDLRSQTVEASRATLLAVARLLIITDMIDVDILLKKADKVRQNFNALKNAQSKSELLKTSQNLDMELHELMEMTRRRVRDLRDSAAQDDLQAAIAMLKITTPIMIASSKAFLQHPGLDGLKLNQNYAEDELNRALDCFCDAVQGDRPHDEFAFSQHGKLNELALNFEKFQRRVYMDPSEYQSHRHRPQLEELLERIASSSGLIADMKTTKPMRHDQIISGVNNLRQALQDLLKEYERNVGIMEPSEDLDLCKVFLAHKIRDLRRHLRRTIVDHVSDVFVDVRTPLLQLIENASNGDFPNTERAATLFQTQANNVVAVARLVANVSNDVDGVRVLRYATLLCEKIAPQVVNAAFLLCEDPHSEVLKENMSTFEHVWFDRVKMLTMAVDSLISFDDFLAVSEAHISEDCQQGIQAIVEHNSEMLDRNAGYIRGRSVRVCDMVLNEIGQVPSDSYSENVKRATLCLRDNVLPHFKKRAEQIVSALTEVEKTSKDGDDENQTEMETKREVDEMIDACQLVYDAVTDIRHALLMNRNPEDVDSDNEYEEDGLPSDEACSQSSASEMQNQQQIMRQLPEESKREIQKQIDVFKITQRKFEYEVGKWDETGNDIIALAKKMCQIMMNMTDFTKGRGPYKTTMDVIKAAQEISEYGAKLNGFARQIGSESVESNTKKDLFAYLERITLFCHQLNVTSKVKADVQVVGDELRVSGLEAAFSLIQNAKNLLNAVILTVKSAYIANTKYRRKENTKPNVVEWRMAAPHKQPLINAPAKITNTHGIVRRASERRQPPLQALTQFQISK
uniref:Uncharacterized protein n=1 Tax=Meloidogyne enterolobii TaxID=390850 RepID=A0A6V7XJR8_MELEN|nr:unnamed protein product [Meloidogyne enterolobii]